LSPATAELDPNAAALAPDARSIDGSASEVAQEAPDTTTGPADRSDRDRVAIPESRESPISDTAEPGPEQARAADASPTSERPPTASSVLEPAPPEPIAPTSARTTTPVPSPGATPEPAQTPTDPVVAAAAPAPEQAQAQAATKGIVLEFTGPSWLEVRDAAGQRIIAGEMKAGDRREVTGQAPLRFTVGRVNNSSMTVDGKPFDLEGRSRGNVARFSLDPESPE
jgi:cytoskeleton protein RodZ